MSQFKGTPGPWFVGPEGKIWRRNPRDLYQYGGGVAGDHPVATAHRGKAYWEDGFPVEDNARLISAAPELLNALQGLLAIIGDSRGVDGYHRNGNVAEWDEFAEISVATAVIAKAIGGENA